MTDPMELVERLDQRAVAARSENIATALGDAIHFEQAAACIRDLADTQEGLTEDLYQAVLVAYRRGATEWTQLNYPQWFDAIVAGRELCPPSKADRGGA